MKNFLSVGDNPLRLDLNRHPTTLVTGRNGSGKSVLVSDSLTFVLFGKSYRGINKPALINTINQRDSVVEIEFSKGNDVYKIVRGQKPARLEIYKNNAALNEEAAVRDTQAYIENDILGFDCNSFIRVCVMSTMNYTPFMQLSAFERRNLVENMLTLKSFSEMSKIHKANVSNLKERITSLQNDLSVRKATYDEKNRTYNLLQQIDSDRTDSIKSNLKGLGEKLEFNEEVVRKLEIQIEEANLQLLNDSALEYKGKIQQIQREIREYEVEISQTEKKVVYFKDHQDCDQCHQSISKESAIESISRYSAIISDHTSAIENLKTQLKVVGDKLDEVNAKIAEVKELEQDLSFAKKSSNVIATDISIYFIKFIANNFQLCFQIFNCRCMITYNCAIARD
jgi:DNA repair exonuclease SbcCD ATPase subunit